MAEDGEDRVQRVDALLPQGRVFAGEGTHNRPVAVVGVGQEVGIAVIAALHQALELALQQAVLILVADHHRLAPAPCQVGQLLRFGEAVGQGLLHPDVLARLQRLPDQCGVVARRGHDDHDLRLRLRRQGLAQLPVGGNSLQSGGFPDLGQVVLHHVHQRHGFEAVGVAFEKVIQYVSSPVADADLNERKCLH